MAKMKEEEEEIDRRDDDDDDDMASTWGNRRDMEEEEEEEEYRTRDGCGCGRFHVQRRCSVTTDRRVVVDRNNMFVEDRNILVNEIGTWRRGIERRIRFDWMLVVVVV